MPKNETPQTLQAIETARLKKKYTCYPKKERNTVLDLKKGTIEECKEKINPIECMMLKMKYESLAGIKQIKLGNETKRENMELKQEAGNSKSYSPDVGNRSFKILSSRNVEISKFDSKFNSNAVIESSPKKTGKTKMSRLSLKKLLNNAPDIVQSNLNTFLDLQSDTNTNHNPIKKIVDKTKKIKKSSRNLIENKGKNNSNYDDVEEKVVYKISNAIFGPVKSRKDIDNNKPKRNILKKKSTEETVDNDLKQPKIKLNKIKKSKKLNADIEINSKTELNDKVDEELQQGLEMEAKHCEKDFKLKSPNVFIDLSSETNLELELIATKPKMRKCKSLDLTKAKSPFTPKKVRFSHEIKSLSPGKMFTRIPSYKSLPGYSQEPSENESSKGNKNAFQFLMDTRYKVIGKNSPGKDGMLEENSVEKFDLTHRKILPQQWDDYKGNTGKRKLEDEEREECIEYALNNRSKRMKKLLNCDDNSKKKIIQENVDESKKNAKTEGNISTYMKEMSKEINCTKNQDLEDENKVKKKDSKTRKVSDSNQLNNSKDNSSSIPKKETEKVEESSAVLINEDSSDSTTIKKSFSIFQTSKSSPQLPRKSLQQSLLFCISNMDNTSKKYNLIDEHNVIEVVQITSPKKNAQKKRKLSLKAIEIQENSVEEDTNKKPIKPSIHQKTARRNQIIDSDETSRESTNSKSSLTHVSDINDADVIARDLTTENCGEESKPAKLSKKSRISKTASKSSEISTFPITEETNDAIDVVKNVDEACLRRSSRVRKPLKHYIEDIEICQEKGDTSKKRKSKSSTHKVASVFINAVPKPKIDPAVLEARRNFLHSTSPQIKRKELIIIENDDFQPFPTVSHTQQKTDSNFWNLPFIINKQKTISLPINFKSPILSSQLFHLGSFTNSQNVITNKITLRKISQVQNKKSILLNIKTKNPDYPVYKSYKFLKMKNKQHSSRETVDLNKTVAKKLLDDSCLIIDPDGENTFVASSENNAGDDVDNNFDSSSLWTDKYKPTSSEDIIGNRSAAVELLKFLKQRLLYCNESTKRKKTNDQNDSEDDFTSSSDEDIPLVGNTMLVRGPHGSGKTSSIYAACLELDINVLELNASSKRTGRILIQKLLEATQSQQIHQQQGGQQKMCLLLVEDIDVVFEQDEGFVAALTQLLQTTKRPIVLTFTDETNSNVQKFIQQYPVITFLQISAKTCSVWLQLVCLLENVLADEESLGELLEWNKGDLRRTLLQLQFCGLTGGDCSEKDYDPDRNRLRMFRRLSVDDTVDIMDDSNTSDLNGDVEEDQHQHQVKSFLLDERFRRACSLGQIWWNFSGFLNGQKLNENTDTQDSPNNSLTLQAIQTFYEALSISDCLHNKTGLNTDDLEPTFTTFQTKLKDSLSLEHFHDRISSELDNVKDMTQFLVHKSFNRIINGRNDSIKFNMGVPEAADRRWRFKQHSCQETFADNLPLNITLDRKSFALDYLPMLISIVKIEQTRLKMNVKRRNRFYSYLRNLHFKFTDSQMNCLNSAYQIED